MAADERILVQIYDTNGYSTEDLKAAVPGLRRYRGTWTLPVSASEVAWDTLTHELQVGWDWGADDLEIVAPRDDFAASLGISHATGIETMGLLRSGTANLLTPYQLDGVSDFNRTGAGLFWWGTGSGKTLAAITSALVKRAPILVVTRTYAVPWWCSEFRNRTTIEAFAWKPESSRRKRDVSLEDYLANTALPAIVVGWENLPSAWAEVQAAVADGVVIFDEIHHKGARSHRRWEHVGYDANGKSKYKLKENVAGYAYRASRNARYRLGLTATLVYGRTRDLWSPLDLIWPDSFGGFYDFARRYCAAFENPHGGMNTNGKSNMDELHDRMGLLVSRVAKAEIDKFMPPKIRQTIYIPEADLVKPTSYKSLLKAARKDGDRGNIATTQLAINASRKRSWAAQQLSEDMRAGLKVVCLVGFIRTAQEVTAALRKRLTQQAFKDIDAKIWRTDGSDSSAVRAQKAVEFSERDGACALIATGDSVGEAIRFRGADVLYMLGLPWNPGQLEQWEGRVEYVRSAEEMQGAGPVRIVYPIAENTGDERVADILVGKLDAVEKLSGEADTGALASTLRGIDGMEDELLDALCDLVEGL